jgi:hypothetical protein
MPADGGRPFKHLDARCVLLLEAEAQGHEVRRVRNADHGKPNENHARRRCPVCFSDGCPLPGIPRPNWLDEAKRLEAATESVAWTYDLMWPTGKLSQVGMATKLHARLSSRWRGTCQGRLSGPDSIPWYYDLLVQDPAVELTLAATPYPTRELALEAESVLREQKRKDGWQVSSDR